MCHYVALNCYNTVVVELLTYFYCQAKTKIVLCSFLLYCSFLQFIPLRFGIIYRKYLLCYYLLILSTNSLVKHVKRKHVITASISFKFTAEWLVTVVFSSKL